MTKPGIVYGNDVSAVAGFLLAASLAHRFELKRFVAFILGTSLVIACGCVINNYLDRGIDAKMARTKQRALVNGRIEPWKAMVYGIILGTLGFWLLLAYTNRLTAAIGALGLFFYVVMYGIYKRRSSWGTVVGSISGAAPIVGGYAAVTGQLDSGALLLFLAMAFWQMPHFYAIAMYRLDDYKAAGLPVLPAVTSFRRTKIEIVLYVVAFIVSAALLVSFGYVGYIYLLVMLLVGGWWLWQGIQGFRSDNDRQWARSMFLSSLIVLVIFSLAVATGALLP